jgi:CRISPR/Cas system endoribonuclease Cas6 (RAMP superfamily)
MIKTHLNIEYYFSKKSLIFTTLLLLAFTSIFTTLIVTLFHNNIGLTIFFAAIFIFFLSVSLPRYINFLYSALTNRPAIVISEEELIDNINRRTFKWTEIKEITYRRNKGKNAFGGHSAIILNDKNSVIQIPHNAIKCKTTEFLNDLNKYHKKYSNKHQ